MLVIRLVGLGSNHQLFNYLASDQCALSRLVDTVVQCTYIHVAVLCSTRFVLNQCVAMSRLVDTVNPRKAADYYLQTADLHETEDKYRESANAVRGAINMWARARE